MKHFKFATIPVGEWRRLKGTTARGDDCDRPHFVPVTERGQTFASAMSSGFFSCGLCPGGVLIDGEWVVGFRFITIGDDAVRDILDVLNKQVEQFFKDSV